MSRVNDRRELRDVARFVKLIIIREAMVRQSVKGNDFRDRMSVQNEE